ncbi:hypothetical protein SAMN04487777_101159 [Priestia aryabhattai B8W22]|nr:hypothetical protein SAMN04487777_101159 [Priestia aryabhattai B8W22]
MILNQDYKRLKQISKKDLPIAEGPLLFVWGGYDVFI